ncbi:hypothetical protein M0R72_02315 [Candidatus Pacearchaeota archaeon]|jgi:hypothetical protein|nr:hypothetical protein [Candidatus Pacearchaeota archaeon]
MQQIITFVTVHWVWIAFIVLYICNLLLGHRSQLDSWVTANPKIGGFFKLVRGFLPADPWLIIQGVSLLVKGTLPAKFAPIVSVIDTPTAALPLPPGVPPAGTPSA